MFAIIGIVVVFGAVLGGYLLEHGNIMVLLQPAELLIIGGAAAGTILVANPPAVLKGIVAGFRSVFGASKFVKSFYQDVLKQMYLLMQAARKQGLNELENDVENPGKSKLFSNWDHHLQSFVCDTLRMAMTGGPTPFELDQMMEVDMEVHHHSAHQPVNALNTVADSLPGLGIVAAVLGVVITMQALGGPPEEIGHKVAAALVGTFLGNPAVLRSARSDGIQDGKGCRRRRPVLLRRAPGAGCVSQRRFAAGGRRVRAARRPGPHSSVVPGVGKGHERQGLTWPPLRSNRTTPSSITPIIIKKKVVHAGHHGGAWKVAYADFVTAMMALFIVLWLMGSSEPVKKAVAGYFRDPSGRAADTGNGQGGTGHEHRAAQGRHEQAQAEAGSRHEGCAGT